MPSIVRDVRVENLLSGSRFLVEWTLNSVSESVTAYEIWRSTQEYQGFEKIAEVQSPTKQYVDKVPYTFGIVFFYKVLARDNTGLRSDITQSNAVQDSTFDDFEEKPFRATTLSFDSFIVNEIPVGIVDGVNKKFTLANMFRFSSVEVYVNGIHRLAVTDFVENTDQQTFSFSNAPAFGSIIQVNYIKI